MGDTSDETRSKTESDEMIEEPSKDVLRHKAGDTGRSGRLLVGGLLRTWTEVSRLNYLAAPSEIASCLSFRHSMAAFRPPSLLTDEIRRKAEEITIIESFPRNVTPLMNEEKLWGCFYNFPELYDDAYSPSVRVLKLRDVAELVAGVLTRDMVAACLTYLHRTPILGDYVYIKLNLSGKRLINIDVLQHYKYLVYLDLSSNLLTNLSVVSHLPYLQFLSVAFNRLETVLEYDTPQWFLTEVHYKYNSVKRIRNLSMFWSITILDLSHNNIKCICGLENLRYLRHLDLSFNHIQKLENLNHMRLLWLDVSYNNISSFELGPEEGLWTLLHLDYLNLNENNLKSMKIFSGCTRLRELHVRNNRLSALLELAVYMRALRRLAVLDMRANPICSAPGYLAVVYDTFPLLVNLDATELDPVSQCSSKMDMLPNVNTFACRRLLRMLYVEQLSRARLSITPPADTEEVPLVVFVGEEGVGKGTLARKLATECGSKIKLGLQHTTASFHSPGHYIEVSRQKFDDMLLAGDLLTYSEMDGESYGLSREEAFISDGKVRICTLDLIGALMLKLRGRRPYLILTACHDKAALNVRQLERKTARNGEYEKRMSNDPLQQHSTLQVLLSGRIIINGILNEIIMSLPDDKSKSEFALDSECSLLMESDVRRATRTYARGADLLTLLTATSFRKLLRARAKNMAYRATSERTRQSESSISGKRSGKNSQGVDTSLYSIYKRSHDSSAVMNSCYDDRKNDGKKKDNGTKPANARRKTDGTTTTRSGSRHFVYDSTKSSKSVTFTGPEIPGAVNQAELNRDVNQKPEPKSKGMSISTCMPGSPMTEAGSPPPKAYDSYPEDADLWLAFLTETGLLQVSEIGCGSEQLRRRETKLLDNPESILQQLNYYHKVITESAATTLRDDYEGIHRLCPGLFHDTIVMDDPKEAFRKAKKIIRDIVNSQNSLRPMFDIDFANNLDYYPTVEQRLEDIRKEIAPRQIFY